MNRAVLLAAGLGGLMALCSPAQAAQTAPCPVAGAAPLVQPPCDTPTLVPCEGGEVPCLD